MYNITASGYEKINGTLNNRDIPVLDLSWTMLYNAISPPSIPGPSEESIGRVGTSCSIIRNTSFGQSFFQIRHDRSGNVTSLHSDLPEVRGIGNRTAACFEVPPPPPKTTDELGSELTTLQKLLNGAVGKIDNLVQGISDIAGKVETEAADRLKGLLDLEVKLKSWIVDGILDIIWTALTREHKGA